MEVILTEDAAPVPVDFVAGNIDIFVIVDIAPVAIITAAAPVPAVAVAAYSVAVVMTDAVVMVIVPIIIVVSPFHDAPSQKSAHYCPGCEVGPGISA